MLRPPPRITLFCLVLCFATAAPALAADMFGWYFPLVLGATWTYENVDIPGDTWVNSVFEEFTYEGHPAFKLGEDVANYTVIHRDGGVITVYAEAEAGIVHDLDKSIVLVEVVVGAKFGVCFCTPCDTSMVRVCMTTWSPSPATTRIMLPTSTTS